MASKPTPTPPGAEITSFDHTLADGSVVICGKPGILKLKLRNILTDELIKDPEIKLMAEAFLSIKTVGGLPFQLRTYNEFEFFMNRFKSEADLDDFCTKYTKLVNPELAKILEDALDEGFDQELSQDAIKANIQQKVMAYERQQRKQVRD